MNTATSEHDGVGVRLSLMSTHGRLTRHESHHCEALTETAKAELVKAFAAWLDMLLPAKTDDSAA